VTLVYHPERCPPNAKLKAFISWWQSAGPFPIVIVTGSRTDKQQAEDYAKGRTVPGKKVTNAQFARQSAHGHDAGIDCQPVREVYAPPGGVKTVYLGDPELEPPDVVAEAVRRLTEYDRIAKTFGLETGENYPGICDRPHACDPNWPTLPLGPGVAPAPDP
jgi:hypothetical protein